MRTEYTETTASVARAARMAQATVAGYAAKGLLPHIKASNGVRLFKPEAATEARKVMKANLLKRGRSRARA